MKALPLISRSFPTAAELNVDAFQSSLPRVHHKWDPNANAAILIEYSTAVEADEKYGALMEKSSDPNIRSLIGAMLDYDESHNFPPLFNKNAILEYDRGKQVFIDVPCTLSQHEAQQPRLARPLIADTYGTRSKSSEQDSEGLSSTLRNIKLIIELGCIRNSLFTTETRISMRQNTNEPSGTLRKTVELLLRKRGY